MSNAAEIRPAVCCACSQQCGVLVHLDGDRIARITGDKAHPSSRGFICPKGAAAHELHYAEERVHRPRKRTGPRGSGQWTEIGWDEALDEIAEKLRSVIDRHGPEAVAYSFGTLHNAEWGLGERFMNLLGSPNTVGQDKICYGPNALGESLTYGFGTTFFTAPVPGVTRCMVLWGMRPSASAPLLWGRIVAARKAGARLIVIDPEHTREARQADLWLQIRPGADAALALGMLHVLLRDGLHDRDFAERKTLGFDALREHVAAFDPTRVAELTWVAEESLEEAVRIYGTHGPAIVHGGNGLCQAGPSAVATARAIACLVALSGNLGVEGGHALSGPPQRILANGDAVCAERLSPDQRRRRLGASRYPMLADGMASLDEAMSRMWHEKRNILSWLATAHEPALWRAIETEEPYPVKALLLQAHAALGSGADLRAARRALEHPNLELFVAHDLFENPTTRLADYLLPACHWLEIPFYSAVYGYLGFAGDYAEACPAPLEPEHQHRSDYVLWRDLGNRMGQSGAWPARAEDFWSSLLEPAGLTFDELAASRGPLFGRDVGGGEAPSADGFGTPSGKVELFSELAAELGGTALPDHPEAERSERFADAFPLVLTTGGRLLEGFHQNAPQMSRFRHRRPHPWVRLHPDTAGKYGIAEGDWVSIETPVGSVRQEAHFAPELHPNVVQADRWWYPERARDAEDPFAIERTNINVCTDAADHSCDPIMGSWLLRGLPCRVSGSAEPV